MKLSELQGDSGTVKLSDLTSQPAPYQASNDMGTLEQLLAMYGRGVAELGQGAKQLGLHAAGAVGLADPSTVQGYDKQVADEAKLYAGDLGQKPGGTVLPMAAQLITTAPIGGAEFAAAKEALPFLGAAGRTALVGAATGATQPVTEGDFAGTKAAQVGLGAGVGAASNVVAKGIGHALELALPANATKAALNMAAKREQSVNPSFVKESEDLARETGVMLTPAQVTGSKPGQMAENAARQSIFSRGIANEGDRARIDQLKAYYDKTLQGISNSDASPEIVGNQVRAATNNITKGLQDLRHKSAAQDFAVVDSLAGGKPVVQASSLKDALDGLISENSVAPEGSGQRGIANALASLKRQITREPKPAEASTILGPDGAPAFVTPGEEGRQLINMTGGDIVKMRRYLSQVSGGQATLAGATDQPMQKRAATMLLDALDNDIDRSSAAFGGDLGKALQTANSRYKTLSEQIDSVKLSPIGKLLGEDVAGAMQAGQFNTLAPEKVAERIYGMKGSEIRTIRGLLEQDQPQAWQAIKAGYLQNAMEKASTQASSAGANTATFVPNKLVGALTQGDARKLQAMFDPAELSQINAIIGTGKRLGDTTGYNFSGTAPMGEALGVMNKIGEGAKQGLTMAAAKAVGSAVAPVLGSRALAKAMTNAQGRATLLELQRLPPGSAQARQLTAWLAANYGAEQPE